MKGIIDLFFKKEKRTLLGIDLTTQDIKIVELTKNSEGKFKIEGYAHHTIPPGLVSEDIVIDTSQIGQIIKDMVSTNKIHTKDVAISVPQSTVITKTITVTGDNDREIESEIEMSGKKYLSMDIEEFDFDFKVLYSQAESNNKDVLLVACKKKSITTRDDTVNIAGLNPTIIDSEAFVYERVYPLIADQVKHELSLKNQEPNSILMVELFDKKLKVVLLNKGKVSYNEEHPIDFEQKYTQKRFKSLKSTLITEEIIDNETLNYRDGVMDTLSRVITIINSENQSSLTAICFMGDKNNIEKVKDFIQDNLQINCLTANPISNMDISNKIDIPDLLEKSSLLVVACGLAMRENIYD